MHTLSFLIVELEAARTTLLEFLEVANGTPTWTGHPAIWKRQLRTLDKVHSARRDLKELQR
jgi:hypothetical protein